MSTEAVPATPTGTLPLDVFGEFDALRRDQPILHLPDVGIWLVSRYADCIAVIRDSEAFTSMNIEGTMHPVPDALRGDLPNGYPVSYPALVNNDPPAHTRIRKLAQKALTPRALAEQEPKIRAIAEELICRIESRGNADLVADFARPFTCTVLAAMLGIPPEDQDRFADWGLAVPELMSPFTTDERRAELAVGQVAFNRYINDRIAEHKSDPSRSDLIGGLVHARLEDEPALSDPEVVAVVAQIIVAGFETTMAAVVNTLMLLASHPAAMDAVRADLSCVSAAVEESLRRLPPARGVPRQTTRDVTLGDVTIPRGERVYALLASACHDEAQFECPAEFRIDRSDVELRRHLVFGQGTHFCLGAPLAKLEICTAVELLLTRLPNLRLSEGVELEWASSFIFQGPAAMPVSWDPPVSPLEGTAAGSAL